MSNSKLPPVLGRWNSYRVNLPVWKRPGAFLLELFVLLNVTAAAIALGLAYYYLLRVAITRLENADLSGLRGVGRVAFWSATALCAIALAVDWIRRKLEARREQ